MKRINPLLKKINKIKTSPDGQLVELSDIGNIYLSSTCGEPGTENQIPVMVDIKNRTVFPIKSN